MISIYLVLCSVLSILLRLFFFASCLIAKYGRLFVTLFLAVHHCVHSVYNILI